MDVAARIAGTADRQDREDALVRGVLTGIAVFRWLAWAWMAALLAVNRTELRQPEAAWSGRGGAVLGTAGPVAWPDVTDLRAVRVVVADDHPVWRSGLRADLGPSILGKLHLNRRQELVRYALEHGID